MLTHPSDELAFLLQTLFKVIMFLVKGIEITLKVNKMFLDFCAFP